MSDGDIKKDMLIILLWLYCCTVALWNWSWGHVWSLLPGCPRWSRCFSLHGDPHLDFKLKLFGYTHVRFCSAIVPKHQHAVLAVGPPSLGHTTLQPTLENLCGATSEPRPSGYITLWVCYLCFPLADASWNHFKLSGGSNKAAGEDQAFLYLLLTHLHHKATWCPLEHLLGHRRSHVTLPE